MEPANTPEASVEPVSTPEASVEPANTPEASVEPVSTPEPAAASTVVPAAMKQFAPRNASLPAPTVKTNYAAETLTVTLPGNLDASVARDEIELVVKDDHGKEKEFPNAFANGDSYTLNLSEFGLPERQNFAPTQLYVTLRYNGTDGSKAQKEIPARPASPSYSEGYNVLSQPAKTTITVDAEFDMGLRLQSDFGSEPNVFGVREGNVTTFTGLLEGKGYWVYLRYAATGESFCSEWQQQSSGFQAASYTYYTAVAASPVIEWREGLEITEGQILQNVVFVSRTGTERIYDWWNYAVEVSDGQGNPVKLPITQPGEYTVKVAFVSETILATCKFDDDTFTFTVTDQPVPASGATIDYFKETATITLPDGVEPSGELSLTFDYNGKTYTPVSPFKDGASYTIALDQLGGELNTELPDSLGVSYRKEIQFTVSDASGAVTSGTLNVPGRRKYTRPARVSYTVGATRYTCTVGGYEVGLALQGQTGNEPVIFGQKVGDTTTITGLGPGEKYTVYMRFEATVSSFRSTWGSYDFLTMNELTHLAVSADNSEYQWVPGLSLTEDALKNSFAFNRVSGSAKVPAGNGFYTIVVTDSQAQQVELPITEAGTYTVKVSLTDEYSNYVLDNDTLTITVIPLDLSLDTVRISLPEDTQMPVYTGRTAWPGVSTINVTVNGSTYALGAADYWQFTASGKNDVEAGDAYVVVSARSNQSNVTGHKELQYTISQQAAALAVNESERTWAQGMSLDEAALRKLFTVNDAGNAPLDGSLYTITVKQDGQAVTLPIVNAGAYTIEIALTGDGENYALNQNSFTYTVSPVAFSGTVSMAGYVYGGTVSTPVLNGYAGDGEVTFHYRAKGETEWTAWQNIAATSLVPGSYELMARVADTANYEGGETAAEFTVSRTELGVAVEMSDYTYGGEVPTPALAPAAEGLSVQWFYKGADGVEHEWQNITGTTLAAGGYTLIARIAQSALYEEAELTASFTVRKAAAPAIEWPTASGITYGQSVSEAGLSAAADSHGTFAWAQPDAVLNAGAQSVTLRYTPNDTRNYDYTGVELTKQIAITVSEKGLESGDISVSGIADQTYTGEAIEPEIVVKDGDRTLAEGTDYIVAYADNLNEGTATVTITGMGNYAGTLTVTFTIRASEQEDEEEQEEEDGQEDTALTPAQQAKMLANGEAVKDLVTDRRGEPMGYEAATEELADEASGEIMERTLVITAGPVRNEKGEIVLRDGEPVYEQRNLHFSQALLKALADLGYTHIRFAVKDAALEWAIADMGEDGNIIRLAPMEAEELSQAERGALGEAEQLSGAYRARITAIIDGEETDITDEVSSLTAWFDAQAIRELAEGESAQCLLVPGDGEPEEAVSTAEYVEEGEGEDKETSYQAKLSESGLFVLMLQ